MNKILALVAVLCAISVIAQENVDWMDACYYVSSSNGDFYYSDLNVIYNNDGWYNGTDDNGNIWFFRSCVVNTTSHCPDGSSVCFVDQKGVINNRGSTSTALFSDYQSEDYLSGYEIIFGVESDSSIKTVVDFVCMNDNETKVSVSTDGQFTTITVYSNSNCPSASYGDDMIYWESYQSFFSRFFFTILLSCCCIALLPICCCCIRRRRCQRNKNIAMKQFSNIAFQPIPSVRPNIQSVQQPNIPIPTYNPYVQQQPQFVYYYPSQQQQQQQHQQIPLQEIHPVVQLNDDEKLAKQLQAQFDRESQV